MAGLHRTAVDGAEWRPHWHVPPCVPEATKACRFTCATLTRCRDDLVQPRSLPISAIEERLSQCIPDSSAMNQGRGRRRAPRAPSDQCGT